MQVLFASSAKSPSVRSLGVMPCQIDRFHDTDKAVPHMGWNTAECFDSPSDPLFTEGISPTSFYYFVHSYCASYDPTQNFEAAQWAHSTTQYGNKVFVSAVRKGSIFGTQFHPKKSGITGLTILDTWIKKPWLGTPPPVGSRTPRCPKPKDGFTKRIIACMDVRANDQGDLVVTKGDQYDVREKVASSSTTIETAGAVRNLGKPVALASKYYDAGADELCLLRTWGGINVTMSTFTRGWASHR